MRRGLASFNTRQESGEIFPEQRPRLTDDRNNFTDVNSRRIFDSAPPKNRQTDTQNRSSTNVYDAPNTTVAIPDEPKRTIKLILSLTAAAVGVLSLALIIRHFTRTPRPQPLPPPERPLEISKSSTPSVETDVASGKRTEPFVTTLSNDAVNRAANFFSNLVGSPSPQIRTNVGGSRGTTEPVEDVNKPKDCKAFVDFNFMFDNRPNPYKSKDNVREYIRQSFNVEDVTMVKPGQLWSDASLIRQNRLAQAYVDQNGSGGRFVGNTPLRSLNVKDFERFVQQNGGYPDSGNTLPSLLIRGAAGSDEEVQIKMSMVVDIVCKSSLYDQDIYLAGNIFVCTARCPPGFETVWFEPHDKDGSPLQVPVLGPDGKPMLDKNGKKITEPQLPQPWCRAKCPVQLTSPTFSKWAYRDVRISTISSSFLNGDSTPVLHDPKKPNDSANWRRTDVGENDAYCGSSLYTRQIQVTGRNIVCGWCTRDLGWNKANETNNLKHKCDTNDRHSGMDFTEWCQRGRLTPLFLEETFPKPYGAANAHQTSAFCSSMSGRDGKRKQSEYIQSPKACRQGDLLPVIAAAYGYGPGDNIMDMQPAIETLGKNGGGIDGFSTANDRTVVRVGNTNFTGFLAACYTRCPVWMTSHGPIEDHLCHESCPPNTYLVKELGQIGHCKKLAIVKRVYIADVMASTRAIINDLARIIREERQNPPK